jgi:phage terminase small subunit
MSLSEKERRFVEAYMGQANGNATQAAILAGYSAKAAHVTASRLLRKAKVKEQIDSRVKSDALVADREERQRFLSTLMRNADAHPLARLKACDQLAKTQGDYISRVEVSGQLQVEQQHELTVRTRVILDRLAAKLAGGGTLEAGVAGEGAAQADSSVR